MGKKRKQKLYFVEYKDKETNKQLSKNVRNFGRWFQCAYKEMFYFLLHTTSAIQRKISKKGELLSSVIYHSVNLGYSDLPWARLFTCRYRYFVIPFTWIVTIGIGISNSVYIYNFFIQHYLHLLFLDLNLLERILYQKNWNEFVPKNNINW